MDIVIKLFDVIVSTGVKIVKKCAGSGVNYADISFITLVFGCKSLSGTNALAYFEKA